MIRIDAGRSSDELMDWLEREVEAASAHGYVPMLDTVSTGPYYGGTGHAGGLEGRQRGDQETPDFAIGVA